MNGTKKSKNQSHSGRSLIFNYKADHIGYTVEKEGMMNEERIIDRLEELYAYIALFPESTLVPAMKKEIEYLESLIL